MGLRVAERGRNHLERAGLLRGEVLTDLILHLPAGEVLREHTVVGEADGEPEERHAEQQQEQDHDGGDRDRAPHDRRGDPVPDAFTHRLRLAVPEDPHRVHLRAEHREHRGQDDDRTERGEQRDRDAGVGERAEEREREQPAAR